MKNPKIYVAGHCGMVGSAIVRRLKSLGQICIITRTCPMMSHINVGSGIDCTIRKLLDVSLVNSLGWEPAIPLEQGLTDTYAWFVEHQKDCRE